ncbi:MAG: TIGR03943 family protein [Spirulina sp. DLM2.Bin59]|nr:MAG: TIGR03943 family protein [Spirulina sp. DLM2.Bin59]
MIRLKRLYPQLLPWLDVLALFQWGALLLKFYVSGQLQLLIHPNYNLLVLAAGAVFLVLSSLRAKHLIYRRRTGVNDGPLQHVTLFPPGLGAGLLLGAAVLGFVIPPAILASDTALQRGVNESLPYTRMEAQSFYNPIPPEERSLLDWVRTLNAYPEPDAYRDQGVDLKGFVIHSPTLPSNYLLISRFVISCCAVDAYPIGLPVQLKTDREEYPQDTWLQVQGRMATGEFDNRRQLVIVAEEIETIPTPRDPYEF